METMTLEPCLFFTGNCREAMGFYQTIFGGELNIMNVPEDPAKKVMHSRLFGGLVPLMASHSTHTEPYNTSFVSLNISGTNEEKLREVFDHLANGGKVTSPMKKEFWGDVLGIVTDKYGVDWQITGSQQAAPETQTAS